MSLPDSHPGTPLNSQSEAALADQTPVGKPEGEITGNSKAETSNLPTALNDQAAVAVFVKTRTSPIPS